MSVYLSSNIKILRWVLTGIYIIGSQGLLAQFLPQTNYKSQVVNEIGQRIAAARGDLREMPIIHINSNSSKQYLIAQFSPYPQPQIVIDEKLYDILADYGIDSLSALACVIGHEMAHFYENHIWSESFSDLMGIAKDRGTAVSIQEKGILEAKADAFGLFYGFLAGFDTYRILPKTLETIYKKYNIPDQLEGYPAKEVRLRFSAEKIREISPLLTVFHSGHFLFLRKEFEAAASCFDYILRHYPGPEIYNNAGLTKVHSATESMEPKTAFFAYPFELDAKTRLKRGTLRGVLDPKEKLKRIEKLLSEAQLNFEKALTMDKTYIPAYINLACTFSLQDNQAAAVGKINELEKLLGTNNLPGNAHLIRGIALVRDDQINKAKHDFDRLKEKDAFHWAYNRELYQQISANWKIKTIHWLSHWPTIENWIKDFWNQPFDNGIKSSESNWEWMAGPNKGLKMIDPEVSVAIPGKNFPIRISGKTLVDGYHLQLELPDYRLDALYSPMNSNAEIKRAESKLNLVTDPNAHFRISGTGGVAYDYFPNERVILEMENKEIKGWWKYEINY